MQIKIIKLGVLVNLMLSNALNMQSFGPKMFISSQTASPLLLLPLVRLSKNTPVSKIAFFDLIVGKNNCIFNGLYNISFHNKHSLTTFVKGVFGLNA